MRWESICVYLIRAVLFWYQSVPRLHKLSFSSVSLYLSPTIQKFYQRSIIEKSKGWGCQNGSTVDSSEGKMFQIRVDNSNHRIESKLMNVFWSNSPHDNEATVSWKSLKTQSIWCVTVAWKRHKNIWFELCLICFRQSETYILISPSIIPSS